MEDPVVPNCTVQIIVNGVTKTNVVPLTSTTDVEYVEKEMRSTYNVTCGTLSSSSQQPVFVYTLVAGGSYFFLEFTTQGAIEGGGSTAGTPGDTNAMFIVIALTRGQRSKKHPDGDIIYCQPIGTAFALSEDIVFTAYHNVADNENSASVEIGLVKEWREEDVFLGDIIVAKYTAGSGKEEEDWAVYTRDMKGSHFQHYLNVCPENELPFKNERIGIHDFPVGLFTSGSSLVIEQQSVKSKVSTYELSLASNSAKPIPTGKRVVKTKPAKKRKLANLRVVQVVGGRIKGSCGAAYVASNGKVFAFHAESLGDGESVSVGNSFSSKRSHTSFSRGLVLCRIPSFMKWYKRTILPRV